MERIVEIFRPDTEQELFYQFEKSRRSLLAVGLRPEGWEAALGPSYHRFTA